MDRIDVAGPVYRQVMAGTASGHIEQLLSGSLHAKVYAGTDPLTGREVRFRKTCKTERANPANSLSDLRNDLDRFLFLLGGSDGEQLFGP